MRSLSLRHRRSSGIKRNAGEVHEDAAKPFDAERADSY